MITCLYKGLAAAALVFGAVSASGLRAQAQSVATYVSPYGDDSSDCTSPDTPCETISEASIKTIAGGTVFVQGPYLSGSPTIGKSLSVVANGSVVLQALLLTSGAASVDIQGVRFNGSNFIGYGIQVTGANKINFVDCAFMNYVFAGVRLAGSAGARVALERVQMSGNTYGALVEAAAGPNAIFIKDSFIDKSTTSAVEVRGAQSTAVLINSTLSGSGQLDLSRVNGGRAISYGNNVIRSGTPSQTLSEN